jgi:uncharacterized RDD family membrane protein YckC
MPSADKLTIQTPEQISIEFPLAGIGSRFLALAADLAIQAFVAIIALFVVLLLIRPLRFLGPAAPQWAIASLTVSAFLLNSAYFAFFEAIWNGQTPGKRYAHLRVMKDDGRPVSVYDAIVRNLLRVIDAIPGPYTVGILSMLFSKQNKRLGDLVAGTVVIRETTLHAGLKYPETHTAGSVPVIDTAQLSAEEFQLIETFLGRCDTLEPALRGALSAQIATRIAARLGIVAGSGWPDTENFLAAVLLQYRSTNRFRS